jgi:hypothetical protein
MGINTLVVCGLQFGVLFKGIDKNGDGECSAQYLYAFIFNHHLCRTIIRSPGRGVVPLYHCNNPVGAAD